MCSKDNGHDSVKDLWIKKVFLSNWLWKENKHHQSFKNNSCTMIAAVIVALLQVVCVSVLDTNITHTASLMLKRPLQCPQLQSHFIRFTFVSLMCLFHLLFFEAAEQNLNFKLFHFHTAAPWQLGNLPVSYVNALHLPRLVMRREQTKAYWRETFLVLCVWVWSKLWSEGKKKKKQTNKQKTKIWNGRVLSEWFSVFLKHVINHDRPSFSVRWVSVSMCTEH